MGLMGLFGTSGIRGDAEKLFTNQFCFDIGRTFAQFLTKHNQEGPIAVGMDPRSSSPRIKEAFASGLIFEGREVYDEGISPVPAVHYITKATDIIASAMISGSHIVGTLNGIKFFAFGDEILKEEEEEIENIYAQEKGKILYQNFGEHLERENRANELYLELLYSKASLPYPQWRVVLDPGNGAQSVIIPTLFDRFGVETTVINASPQEEFTARDSEAGSGFEQLQEKVRETKSNFGIAWDADGDRCVFVDEEGTFVPGDYTGALIAKHGDTPIVVTPINTSQVIEHLGKPVVRTKVGSPYVVSEMKKQGATFGFEANGGGIFAEVMYSRDGGMTTVAILNLLAYHKKSLRQLLSELPQFSIYRTKVEYPWELKDIIIERAKSEFKGKKVEEVDGLKIWVDTNSWILFRSSANAPEFRVFAEAQTHEEAENLGRKGIEFVKQIIKQ